MHPLLAASFAPAKILAGAHDRLVFKVCLNLVALFDNSCRCPRALQMHCCESSTAVSMTAFVKSLRSCTIVGSEVVLTRSSGNCLNPEVAARFREAVSTSMSACANMFEARGAAERSSNTPYSMACVVPGLFFRGWEGSISMGKIGGRCQVLCVM